MLTDRQGNALPGATIEAAALFDHAVEAFNLYAGDPLRVLDQAMEAAPGFAMPRITKGYLLGLATEPGATADAKAVVAAVKTGPLDERARSHLAALDRLLDGDWTAAALVLDRHNARHPRDLVALQAGHLIDFYRASARDLRDRIARVLPQWTPDVPGYSVLLGMHAFGLEECGNYARAEEQGRRALAMQPLDSWAHHAVAHVMEMQGRAEDGIGWMIARERHWAADDNFFKVHNWWHRALFHLDLGEFDEALALYDGPIREHRSTVALDQVDASALLWRLQLLGHDVGDRWRELAESWDRHADGRTYPFNDWHAVMAYLGAGRHADVQRIVGDCRAAASERSEAAGWARNIGVPLMEGFAAFWHGDYDTAVERLHAVGRIANAFGGSHAQRDVIDWTLTEAALRAGSSRFAAALANERAALKPHGVINLSFLSRARADRRVEADTARPRIRAAI